MKEHEPDEDGVVAAEPLPVNLEMAVSELRKIVDEIEALDAKKKGLEEAKESFRELIKDQMLVQGVTKFSTPNGTIYGKNKKYQQIKDFALLEKFVLETGHLEIFQRRLNGAAVEELGMEVPGVEAYEKFEITFRRK